MCADEGPFPVSVTLTDDTPGAATATASSTANVAEGDVLLGAGSTIAATEGQSFTGTVATFTDTGYPGNAASDFTATIDWGDGAITTGIVAGSGGARTGVG